MAKGTQSRLRDWCEACPPQAGIRCSPFGFVVIPNPFTCRLVNGVRNLLLPFWSAACPEHSRRAVRLADSGAAGARRRFVLRPESVGALPARLGGLVYPDEGSAAPAPARLGGRLSESRLPASCEALRPFRGQRLLTLTKEPQPCRKTPLEFSSFSRTSCARCRPPRCLRLTGCPCPAHRAVIPSEDAASIDVILIDSKTFYLTR